MYHVFITHVFVEDYLGCFHFLAFVNRMAMNIPEQVSVEWDVRSFGYVPRSGIADHMVDLFFVL